MRQKLKFCARFVTMLLTCAIAVAPPLTLARSEKDKPGTADAVKAAEPLKDKDNP